MRDLPSVHAMVRLELLRILRSGRTLLGVSAAAAILVGDSLLRGPEERAVESVFLIAFAAGLVASFRTGWAEDRIVAFDELLVPALVHPRDYYLSRIAAGAVWIVLVSCALAVVELLLSRDGRSTAWLASRAMLAAWLFLPAALWAEHHSRLRWPMVFPFFMYLAAAVVAEPLWGAASVRSFVGLSGSRPDFTTLAPALWRGALVVPLLLLLLYLHAFPARFRQSRSERGAPARHG
jgi:hypothetical protein